MQIAAILHDAVRAGGAVAGKVRAYDRERQVLTLAAHFGFSPEFCASFQSVRMSDTAAGTKAARLLRRVSVLDLSKSDVQDIYSEVARREGFRAYSATPILTAERGVVGILSTHYPTSYVPSMSECIVLDACARRLAQFWHSAAPDRQS